MPDDEAQRLAVLRSFGVLNTPADAALDRITALAQVMFEAPIALISLIDDHRQWFKSHQGLTATEFMRKLAQQLRQMQDRLGADAEPEGLSRQAHSVRGFAATLGFSEVADAYQALESACRDGKGEMGQAARAALTATEVSLREIEGRLAA